MKRTKDKAKRSAPKNKRSVPRARKIDPQQPYVGTYRLGSTNVEVYGNMLASGGDFYCVPDSKSPPRIKIGFRYNHWWELVAVLQHEAFEFVASQMECRFVHCGTSMRASDTYRFIFNHEQFSRICEEVGYFLSKALPDLSLAYRKYGRGK